MDRRTFLTATGSGLLLAGCAGRVAVDPRAMCRAVADVSDARFLKATAGLRPFRNEGFVLERQALGGKTLVHNYGHGGGGITLSWGCSTMACDLVPRHVPAAVIGAGVMGLTTARLLQERGQDVTILTAELPQATTSWVSGGQVKPTGVGRRLAPEKRRQLMSAMAISWERFQALVGTRYGVRWLDTFEAARGGRTALEDRYFPVLDEAQGLRRFRTMYVETPRYLSELLADFLRAGGRMRVRRFGSLDEVAALDEPAIVNCTGIGARALVSDAGMIPIRGQLALVERQPGIDVAYNLPEGYCFPRDDAVLLGGTWQRGDRSREPDPATTARILAAHREIAATRCFT
ncbi:FAD-dependent oxidoreductase [Sphingomicrobium sp. XHP0235]|uniref:FAD-dependent oxidoreductase n=1 Tax=Sphingomicrobium aquimarinum TaxID=3133971 RepID=UPI0031FEA543